MNPLDELEAREQADAFLAYLDAYARRGRVEAENALLLVANLAAGVDLTHLSQRYRTLRDEGLASQRGTNRAQLRKHVMDALREILADMENQLNGR